MTKDVLQPIPTEELPRLRDMYKKYQPSANHVCSVLNVCLNWHKLKPNNNYLTFFAPHGDWETTGTIILLMQLGCYDLFVFTLEKTCEVLYTALSETKLIDWTKTMTIYIVLNEHLSTTAEILIKKNVTYQFLENPMYQIPRERALKFDTELEDNYLENIYIAKLNRTHAALINDLWPHKHEGSEEYIAILLEMNPSYGVFLKSDGRLVSWVLKNQFGSLGCLQTVEEYKRRKYGVLVTKALSKEIAKEGNPWTTVVAGNKPSENLFKNLGFREVGRCTFIEVYANPVV